MGRQDPWAGSQELLGSTGSVEAHFESVRSQQTVWAVLLHILFWILCKRAARWGLRLPNPPSFSFSWRKSGHSFWGVHTCPRPQGLQQTPFRALLQTELFISLNASLHSQLSFGRLDQSSFAFVKVSHLSWGWQGISPSHTLSTCSSCPATKSGSRRQRSWKRAAAMFWPRAGVKQRLDCRGRWQQSSSTSFAAFFHRRRSDGGFLWCSEPWHVRLFNLSVTNW